MIKFSSLTLLAVSLVMFSCKKNCKRTACTDSFGAITIEVVDNADSSVALDDHYTIRKSNGAIIRPNQLSNDGRVFVVLDDNYVSELQQNQDDFDFVAIKGNTEIGRATIKINADCCHVNKVSGATKLVIQ